MVTGISMFIHRRMKNECFFFYSFLISFFCFILTLWRFSTVSVPGITRNPVTSPPCVFDTIYCCRFDANHSEIFFSLISHSEPLCSCSLHFSSSRVQAIEYFVLLWNRWLKPFSCLSIAFCWTFHQKSDFVRHRLCPDAKVIVLKRLVLIKTCWYSLNVFRLLKKSF